MQLTHLVVALAIAVPTTAAAIEPGMRASLMARDADEVEKRSPRNCPEVIYRNGRKLCRGAPPGKGKKA
ncbi:hypothetical protein MAPG_08402 [Magnaporthiopsis poae ATCC 64411]|uniref:Uncharacterized protein n=1 Tax=Magnaporthiopsis poae (strain ATCC 64411 / 73-15) TaxID=644358 RepID=A0A0C4E798_MAGP6|nr:hypothetical protein MAPG_08402 [Magnaporthiopsis poae ATCC 64411]